MVIGKSNEEKKEIMDKEGIDMSDQVRNFIYLFNIFYSILNILYFFL